MVIWKFSLGVTDAISISMPKGARILSVQVQHGAPQLWALVDEDAPQKQRVFRTIGTGNPIPYNVDCDRLLFIGTYQLHGGALVFHVFEEA